MTDDAHQIRLPLSKKDAIAWEMHVILDHVLARGRFARMQANDQTAFATEILRKFGLDRLELESARARVLPHVPRDLDALDMNDLLGALETIVPFTWVNDLVTIPPSTRESLVKATAAILEARERPSPPEPLANAIIEEYRRAVGDQLADTDTVRGIIGSRIVREVWQCKRGEERALSERIVDDVASASRIKFGP